MCWEALVHIDPDAGGVGEEERSSLYPISSSQSKNQSMLTPAPPPPAALLLLLLPLLARTGFRIPFASNAFILSSACWRRSTISS